MKKFGQIVIGLVMLGLVSVKGMAQTFVAEDDPVAAMLDSLATKKILDKLYAKGTLPKGKTISGDTVPMPDEYVYENRLAKLDAVSPFDLQYHNEVKGYIELYAMRKRGLVSKMLGLSQIYYPVFEQVLDKYNLPLELKHLAVIESALNPNARSRAGAVGLWQFMYPTAKLQGLNINSYVDERSDPYKATVAAAEYLQFLYKMFNDWQMVLAAYNAGPGSINKAIRRSGGKKTYWEIRPYLPKETQAYVPAFIAANYVMNYYAEHNIVPSVPKKSYFELDTMIIREPVTFEQLAAILEVDVEEIQYYNPSYKKNVIPSGGHVLTMPKQTIGKFINNEEEIYAFVRKQADEKNIASVPTVKEIQITHVVKRGEKLNTIARKYGVTMADLRNWNFIGKKGIQPGKKLTIYKSEIQPASDAAKENSMVSKENKSTNNNNSVALAENNTAKKFHIVKKGETLYRIASKYGISVNELVKLNGLSEKAGIQIGQKLKIK